MWNKNRVTVLMRRLCLCAMSVSEIITPKRGCCQTLADESQTFKQGGLCHWQLIQTEHTWEIWGDACLPPWATLSIISWLWKRKQTKNQFWFHEIRKLHTESRGLTTQLALQYAIVNPKVVPVSASLTKGINHAKFILNWYWIHLNVDYNSHENGDWYEAV